jgi:pimeloyl-ACP methyl ester carboxylesterase
MKRFVIGLSWISGWITVLLLAIHGCQTAVLYNPDPHVEYTPLSLMLMDYEDITLTTSDDVKLSAWFVPALDERAVLLLCHGNAGNMSHRLGWIGMMNRLGFSVMAFDYRGYGDSEGKPTEEGTYRDAEAAWQYLVQTRRIDPNRIIIFGRSLGGAVAANLASRHRAGGLILEAAFTSYPDIAEHKGRSVSIRWMAAYDYNTVEALQEVSSPVLVIHSREDKVVPFQHGQALFAVALPPKMFLEIRGSHTEAYRESEAIYCEGILEFVDHCMAD